MPPKGAFYGSFEMQQRRDVANDQFAMTPPGSNVPITTPSPSNNGAIHNSYGPPPQALLKQTPNTAKNRFNNANTPDAYYGAGGAYFGAKHPNPNAEYFGKYEAEFIAHQQKMSNQMGPFGANQPSKHDFNEAKPSVEFPHLAKGEMHPGPKQIPTPVQPQQPQLHGKNVDFHYNKTSNPHLAAQNFYNQHHGPHTANADGTHQMPMQYNSNQYFANEFGSSNEMEYFEQKTASSQAQSGYYDMYNNTNNNGNEFNGAIDNAYTAPSNGQLPNEHCEHFGYPQQYYDGANQHHHPHHHHHPHSHPHSGNASMPPMQTPQVHQPSHVVGHAPNTMNANHQQFHHGVANAQSYHAAQQMNGTGGAAAHLPNAQMDNSNSSSDFNFLSNLANDFAPEYYQLS